MGRFVDMSVLVVAREDEDMALRLALEEPEAGPWRVELLSVVIRTVRIRDRVPGSVLIHTDDIAWEHSRFGWADLLIDGILAPVHEGKTVSYRPPRWDVHGRDGSIDIPVDCPLVIIEGDGAGRREVAHLIDTLIWVQADEPEARLPGQHDGRLPQVGR
jgi:hypothetical protein